MNKDHAARECPCGLCAGLRKLAPAPDEFTEKHGVDLRGIKVGEPLTQEQWDAVTAFVRDQEAIIDAYKERAQRREFQERPCRSTIKRYGSNGPPPCPRPPPPPNPTKATRRG